jgi:hypothetical protein
MLIFVPCIGGMVFIVVALPDSKYQLLILTEGYGIPIHLRFAS